MMTHSLHCSFLFTLWDPNYKLGLQVELCSLACTVSWVSLSAAWPGLTKERLPLVSGPHSRCSLSVLGI